MNKLIQKYDGLLLFISIVVGLYIISIGLFYIAKLPPIIVIGAFVIYLFWRCRTESQSVNK